MTHFSMTRGRRARRAPARFVLALFIAMLPASRAFAQPAAATGPALDVPRATFDIGAWFAVAKLSAAGERGGIFGSRRINFNDEFGLENKPLLSVSGSFRPTARQKVGAHLTPIKYEMSASLAEPVTFAGIVFPANTPTNATVSWLDFGFSYQYDIVARPRVRVGLVGEIERTNIKVEIQNAQSNAITRSSEPTLPLAGASLDIALTPRSSLHAKVVILWIPDQENSDTEYGGHYAGGDVVWSWALTPRLGIDAAYRLIDIRHLGHEDSGTLRIHGVSVSLAVRR
jgi:hypothetical protein